VLVANNANSAAHPVAQLFRAVFQCGLAKLVLGLVVLFILEPNLMPNPRLDTVPGIIASVFGTLTLWALVFALAVWLVRFLNRRRVPQTLGPGETPPRSRFGVTSGLPTNRLGRESDDELSS